MYVEIGTTVILDIILRKDQMGVINSSKEHEVKSLVCLLGACYGAICLLWPSGVVPVGYCGITRADQCEVLCPKGFGAGKLLYC